MRTRVHNTWWIGLLTLLSLLGSPQIAAAQPAVPDVRPAVGRIDVVPGRPLILPVQIVNERALRAGTFEARLDDGRPIPGQLVWIGVAGLTPGNWLGPRAQRVVIPAPEARTRSSLPPGGWHLVCPMPVEAVGLGLWFAQERSDVNWLTDPWRLGRDANGRVDPGMWAGTLNFTMQGAVPLREGLDHLLRDPTRRWRARLMLGELEPGPLHDPWSVPTELQPDDPTGVLAALGAYQDGLWQVALARLWVGDAEVAAQVRNRLGQVAQFQDTWAQVFPHSVRDEIDLRDDLLNPFVDEATLPFRARAWLLGLPAAVAWVADDAGFSDAETGLPAPTIRILGLAAESAMLSGIRLAPELLEPGLMIQQSISARSTDSVGMQVQSIPVRVGPWATEVSVILGKRPATPPGTNLGPLVNDWTHAAWILQAESEGAVPANDSVTVARLFRAGPDGWKMLLRVRSPASEHAQDAVTFWFGPAGQPSAITRVAGSGLLQTMRPGVANSAPERAALPVAVDDSGWSVVVDLPAGVIEPGQLLRVGMVRTDAAGERTAWPRRMLPWDTEPGRLAFDLSGWDGF